MLFNHGTPRAQECHTRRGCSPSDRDAMHVGGSFASVTDMRRPSIAPSSTSGRITWSEARDPGWLDLVRGGGDLIQLPERHAWRLVPRGGNLTPCAGWSASHCSARCASGTCRSISLRGACFFGQPKRQDPRSSPRLVPARYRSFGSRGPCHILPSCCRASCACCYLSESTALCCSLKRRYDSEGRLGRDTAKKEPTDRYVRRDRSTQSDQQSQLRSCAFTNSSTEEPLLVSEYRL